MKLTKKIRDYYKTADLTLPSNPGWRTWKVKTEKGFFHIKHRINSIDKLRKMLVAFAPIKVYHSCAFWLNPTRMHGKYKKNYIYADTLFLGMELYFDFDVVHYEKKSTYKTVLKEASQLYNLMKFKSNYKFKKITWSGTHGFSMVFDDNTDITEQDPLKRIKLFKKTREKLKKELDLLEFETLDTNLITDIFRIYKCENTYDFSSGYKIKQINPLDLTKKTISQILQSIPNIYNTPVSQFLAMIRTNVQASEEAVCKSRKGFKEGAGVTSPFKFYNFIDNSTGWKDRFIPFIVLPSDNIEKQLIKLNRLQHQYSLGPLFILRYSNSIGAISLKALSRRRIEKILRNAGSLNYSVFKKYKYVWIRFSNIFEEHNKNIENAPYYIDILEGKMNGQASRPHIFFLKQIYGIDYFYPHQVGIDNHSIKTVKIKCHQNL